MSHVIAAAGAACSAHWRLKLALSAVLTPFFCVPYFTLQRIPVFPVRTLAPTAIDDAIGFVPQWVWVYQTVYLLLSIVPWLAVAADDLRRYARGFVLVSSVGFAFFLFLPIQAPRPDVVPPNVMYRVLVSYDTTLNSFPSLHVGLSVYTVLFAAHASRGRLPAASRIGALALLSAWAAAIAFSALATKQHYAVDLPPGVLLALLCHRWFFQRSVHVEQIPSGPHPHSPESVPQRTSALSAAAAGDIAAAAGRREPTGRGGPRVPAQAQRDLRAGHS